VAFETGMRKREVLDLLWEQVDLRNGTIALAPQDTKSEAPRLVMLTARLAGALKALPRGIGAAPVFPNPKTGQPWKDLRRPFRRTVRKVGLHGLRFHDLRRSFVTRARKAGIRDRWRCACLVTRPAPSSTATTSSTRATCESPPGRSKTMDASWTQLL
jgi:integrase